MRADGQRFYHRPLGNMINGGIDHRSVAFSFDLTGLPGLASIGRFHHALPLRPGVDDIRIHRIGGETADTLIREDVLHFPFAVRSLFGQAGT